VDARKNVGMLVGQEINGFFGCCAAGAKSGGVPLGQVKDRFTPNRYKELRKKCSFLKQAAFGGKSRMVKLCTLMERKENGEPADGKMHF
jgi:hypothetical protein